MKNVLNAVSAILIILFLGWQFCGDCYGKKCDKSDTKECDYSKYKKSGATKCKSYETKKECPNANIDNADGDDIDVDLDDADINDADDADADDAG